MSPGAKKILWLVELLIRERPRTSGEIEASTELPYRDVEAACYELVQSGVVRLRPDSKLEWVDRGLSNNPAMRHRQ